MAIKLKYQGKEYSKNRQQIVYKQTFVGTQSEIDTKAATCIIGALHSGKGYLQSFRKSQGNGIFWELEVEYKTTQNVDSSNDDGNTIVGKKSATLSVRNIQMPLQHLPNYKTNWNYYLACRASNSSSLPYAPDWWYTASNSYISIADRPKYNWVKSPSELPLEKDSEGKYWFILKQPKKPGVQYYDLSCFVVNISAKYGSATAAGNAISKNINKISTPEQTFGLTGGNWKMDQASIQYDGKYWIANMTYTKSGDSLGWDTDIYTT